MGLSIKKSELSKVLLDSGTYSSSVLIAHLKEKYGLSNDILKLTETDLNRYFMKAFNNRFKKAMHDKDKFIQNNEAWLKESFAVPTTMRNTTKKSYAAGSSSTKRRRLDETLEQFPVEDLLKVCNKKMKNSNTSSDPHVVEEEIDNIDVDDTDENHADDEVLALFLDSKLTKFQYNAIRSFLIRKNIYSLPHYKKITAAKKRACPKFEVTETGCSTKLQDILDHSAIRLVKIPEIQNSIIERNEKRFNLVLKYGCDGTSGFTQYRQAFTESKNVTNNSVVIYGMVPLFLEVKNREDSRLKIWQNENPSSTKYCRVIKFSYEKEEAKNVRAEMKRLNEQIQNLRTTKTSVQGREISINYTLLCTMIDGKTRQALTETESSQRCCVCGALPSEVNDLAIVRRKRINLSAYQYGLSTLHGWIRFLEWVLHLAYKLRVKKHYKKLTDHENQLIAEDKKRIQDACREELGILVDCVKQGTGNTNDGNIARKFFEEYRKVSIITNVREEFIKRLYVIMQAITSKKSICVENFKSYCDDTAKLYIEEYKWFPMPTSCHMILLHGSQIVESFFVPIGQLSEEAQEAKNKDFKRVRENNTRKSSVVCTNEDLMRYLEVSSDPYIAHLRCVSRKPPKKHLAEVCDLLLDEELDIEGKVLG